jgi:hypothetical protein
LADVARRAPQQANGDTGRMMPRRNSLRALSASSDTRSVSRQANA